MKKIGLMLGNIALYIGIFYALLYLLRATYHVEALAGFAGFLDRNPAMFMAVLFTGILLVYLLLFRLKSSLWPSRKQTLFQAVGFRRLAGRHVWLLLGMGVAGCLFSIGLIEIDWIARRFPSIPGLVADTMRSESIVYVILGAGLIAPAFEEILFRGLIYPQLRTVMSLYTALVLQALVYAYFQPSLSLSVISFGSGMIYGMLLVKLRSLWAPILVQTSAMSLIFLAKYAGFYEWMDGLGEGALYVITAVSLLFLLGATAYIWRSGHSDGYRSVKSRPIATGRGIS